MQLFPAFPTWFIKELRLSAWLPLALRGDASQTLRPSLRTPGQAQGTRKNSLGLKAQHSNDRSWDSP